MKLFTVILISCILLAVGVSVGGATRSPRIEIDNPGAFSRIYAMSDVHGMFQNLVPLLMQAGIVDSSLNWNAGNSLFVVVGDSIDKGPQSIETLDLWIKLQAQAPASGGAVIHLLGNHEAEFLADPQNSKASALLSELAQKNIPVEQLTDPTTPRGHFLRSMPASLRIGTWLFCHAGFFPNIPYNVFESQAQSLIQSGNYGSNLLIGSTSLLEAKDWWVSGSQPRALLESVLSRNGFNGVVFGHQPTGLNVIGSDAMSSDRRLIKIDNGMAPEAGAHPGSLLVFPRPSDLSLSVPPAVFTIHSGSNQLVPLPFENAGPAIADPSD